METEKMFLRAGGRADIHDYVMVIFLLYLILKVTVSPAKYEDNTFNYTFSV